MQLICSINYSWVCFAGGVQWDFFFSVQLWVLHVYLNLIVSIWPSAHFIPVSVVVTQPARWNVLQIHGIYFHMSNWERTPCKTFWDFFFSSLNEEMFAFLIKLPSALHLKPHLYVRDSFLPLSELNPRCSYLFSFHCCKSFILDKHLTYFFCDSVLIRGCGSFWILTDKRNISRSKKSLYLCGQINRYRRYMIDAVYTEDE